MKVRKGKYLLVGLIAASTHQLSAAGTPPSHLPEARYDSEIKEQDYLITQEQKGKWAVNCRQRINPASTDKRCSATDGRQILKFTAQAEEPAPQPAKAFEQAAQLTDGYILQLAAFSTQEAALRFQATHSTIRSRVVSTTVQNVQMFNVITPVIENFKQAQVSAENTAKTLGYLPWIRTTDSI